jgi:isopentenyl-diphosphate delta-isomerase
MLIEVSADDIALGPVDKARCHAGSGILHRAFSAFLFDPHGRLLLQQRSALKPLWPGYWANSCCSHPRWGETLEHAVVRRVGEELGASIEGAPDWRFRFIYQARYEQRGSEYELCHVFTGRLAATTLRPDPAEVAQCRWVDPDTLERELQDPQALFTPWLRLEWPRLRRLLHARAA